MANCTTSTNSTTLQIIDPGGLPCAAASQDTLKTILTDAFVFLGAIAFLMIVIAGLRYVFARGNSDKMSQAKNMIQYSTIGLIIASLAATLVNFVIGRAG